LSEINARLDSQESANALQLADLLAKIEKLRALLIAGRS
jgi:hypothetical protein